MWIWRTSAKVCKTNKINCLMRPPPLQSLSTFLRSLVEEIGRPKMTLTARNSFVETRTARARLRIRRTSCFAKNRARSKRTAMESATRATADDLPILRACARRRSSVQL